MESQQLYLMHRNKHREAAKMRRQRNMAQRKEQRNLHKKVSDMETSNLSHAEFKTLVLRMLREPSEGLSVTAQKL